MGKSESSLRCSAPSAVPCSPTNCSERKGTPSFSNFGFGKCFGFRTSDLEKAMHRCLSPMRRTGLTLIEVLVVIAIVLVTASMVLPAIQQVREAARRVQCQNHLRQIGLALHNYQSAFNRYPPPARYQKPPGMGLIAFRENSVSRAMPIT